jgi:hypothetical protein|nr:MAG TPA: hypothetical protein [Caudoviricetes sp.]
MDGYKVLNLNDFDALDIPRLDTKIKTKDLDEQDITLFKANLYNVMFLDLLFTINLNDKNPVLKINNDKNLRVAVYVDANRDLWVGYENIL